MGLGLTVLHKTHDLAPVLRQGTAACKGAERGCAAVRAPCYLCLDPSSPQWDKSEINLDFLPGLYHMVPL